MYRFVSLVCLGAISLGGCKSKPSLVGHWDGSMPFQGQSLDLALDFGQDGSLVFHQNVMEQSHTQRGTYAADDKAITMTIKSVESPLLTQALIEKTNAQLKKEPQSVKFTYTWKDDSTIDLTQVGAPAPMDKPFTVKRKN